MTQYEFLSMYLAQEAKDQEEEQEQEEDKSKKSNNFKAPPPMSRERVNEFNNAVKNRHRSNVIVPAKNGNDLSFKKSIELGIGKVSAPNHLVTNGLSARDMVMYEGKHHRVLFSIRELEATDAVEQFMLEMSDENMTWHEALKSVCRMRRKYYSLYGVKGAKSHAQIRREHKFHDSENNIRIRFLELLELLSLKKKDRLCRPEEIDEMVAPPVSTNLDYWKLKDMTDFEKIYTREIRYFAFECPKSSFRIIYDSIPWFYERGHDLSKMMAALVQLKIFSLVTRKNVEFQEAIANLSVYAREDDDAALLLKLVLHQMRAFDGFPAIPPLHQMTGKPGVKSVTRPRLYYEDAEPLENLLKFEQLKVQADRIYQIVCNNRFCGMGDDFDCYGKGLFKQPPGTIIYFPKGVNPTAMHFTMPDHYLIVRKPNNGAEKSGSNTLYFGDNDGEAVKVRDIKSVFNIIKSQSKGQLEFMCSVAADPAVVKAKHNFESEVEKRFFGDIDQWKVIDKKQMDLKRLIFMLVLRHYYPAQG